MSVSGVSGPCAGEGLPTNCVAVSTMHTCVVHIGLREVIPTRPRIFVLGHELCANKSGNHHEAVVRMRTLGSEWTTATFLLHWNPPRIFSSSLVSPPSALRIANEASAWQAMITWSYSSTSPLVVVSETFPDPRVRTERTSEDRRKAFGGNADRMVST